MAHEYEKIAKAIVEDEYTYTHYQTKEKTTSYDPIYWDRGYSETNEKVMSAFLAGDSDEHGFAYWRELAYDVVDEWVADAIWEDAKRLADEYRKDHEDDDYEDDELLDAIREQLGEIQTQDVALEWLRNMEPPKVRVMLTDEDHPDSWVENDEDWTPERLATNAGIEHTEKNLKACASILANAYYPGTCKLLFLVFRMDIPDESVGDKVRIKGEVELWACNPFMGDGHAEEVEVDITIDRAKLSTDKEACGYSYEEVFGPHWPSVGQPELTFITSKKEQAA
jgi:hypothetical protein